MAVRIDIQIDQDVLDSVIAELNLSNPPTFTLNHSGKVSKDVTSVPGTTQIRGMYDHVTNHVTIASQRPSHRLEGLFVMTKHLRFTTLHELRHAWQREHWSIAEQIAGREDSYATRREEQDANAWAEYAMPLYPKLLTITRTHVGANGFARMTQRAKEAIR